MYFLIPLHTHSFSLSPSLTHTPVVHAPTRQGKVHHTRTYPFFAHSLSHTHTNTHTHTPQVLTQQQAEEEEALQRRIHLVKSKHALMCYIQDAQGTTCQTCLMVYCHGLGCSTQKEYAYAYTYIRICSSLDGCLMVYCHGQTSGVLSWFRLPDPKRVCICIYIYTYLLLS